MNHHLRLLALAAILALSSACENNSLGATEKGALVGTGIGAGLGAIVGHEVGSTGAGIAIGSAFGALSGGMMGAQVDRTDQRLSEQDRRIAEQDRTIEQNRQMLDELKRRGIDARETDRGVTINLPDVLFEFDSARLTGGARSVTRDIADVLRTAGGRRISVEGHTDSVGTIGYNQRLSEDRAAAVAGELGNDGISRRQIAVRGYGEDRPVASNETEGGRARNRRVEVVVEN